MSAVLSLPRLCFISCPGVGSRKELCFSAALSQIIGLGLIFLTVFHLFLFLHLRGLPHGFWFIGSRSNRRARDSSWRASPAQGGAVAMQNWPSLCLTLVIIFAWFLLKLSMTFYTHPTKRSPHDCVIPGETVRMKLLRRMTFQGLPRLVC